MSITDELREWINGNTIIHVTGLRAIADRIDAEHERAVMSAMNDALYHANDESMAELGWVRLPKDADGVPFRIGDKVDSDHYEDGTVTGIQCYKIYNGGIRTLIAVRPDGWDVAMWHTPDEYRHHHGPTVEDVLLEACKAYHGLMTESMSDVAHDMPAPSEIIAEYAAKLRLRSDAE
jgi:hypothetical protein